MGASVYPHFVILAQARMTKEQADDKNRQAIRKGGSR